MNGRIGAEREVLPVFVLEIPEERCVLVFQARKDGGVHDDADVHFLGIVAAFEDFLEAALDFEFLYYRGDAFQYRLRIDRQKDAQQ